MSNLTKLNHAAGIFADMSVDGPAIGTLVAIIDRAKNLPNRKTMGKQNPYCAARLGKEAKKTPTDLRGGQTPRWDYELRFTVHESPDYYKLKVSVFNDDKKTDLIGETWVDLQTLIIPGGSQNDHWHHLQCKGKYAGDIRIEMTYYDTREQDEGVKKRRERAKEKAEGKVSPASSSGFSGPRQLKRRPLPTDPSGAPAPRPLPVEQPVVAPALHHPMPSRPPVQDHAQTMATPLPPSNTDALLYTPPETAYDNPSYNTPSSAMQTQGAYDAPDSYQQKWDNPAPTQALPPAGTMRHNTNEAPYSYSDKSEPQYHSHPPRQMRSHSDYDQRPPSQDYRTTSQELDYENNTHGRSPHDAYSVVSPQYSANPMTFGHPRMMKALPAPYHPEYATMQPRVEDEDEDAPPPPPPVHRSRMAQPASPAQPPVGQSPSPYTPYSPGYTSNTSSMPASLVAGYESEEHDRVFEGRNSRKNSTSHLEDEMMIPEPLAPSPAPVPTSMPAQASVPIPMPYDPRCIPSEHLLSLLMTVQALYGVEAAHARTGSSVPFSPDFYNTLNPQASRSITSREPSPAYETPSQARDAAVRSEVTPVRDLDQPIIGDDGREIDPSDHLPTDTWAPEPERKSRKPEVIIRFKHSARPTSRGNDTASRSGPPPRVGFRTTDSDRPSMKYTTTHIHSTHESVDRTPPRADRAIDSYGSYTHSRSYNTPTSAERPRSSRGSVSPSPGSRSPLYDYSPGPPIPSKVPISSGSPGYPVAVSNPHSGNPGMDALSRELKSIDIGSVACSPSRAVRKYAPKPSATMGYAR
ncbi:hypothetical protein N7462_002097 [Penicillium macrosclerotiorum]|uniref:uncharacterized protein n=1 Tax=Penicillium macrosclerotiorum TaxID=303699 RepID=UPI00254871A6|nr:uncharacterized protein N7462_002097 [Penicillium macrosclerotiorum]KAJ5692674.1 hypothetical protein N7462_002097 [Penicillium macrosclerotiorum]